ncbi:MAG: 3-deoxy-7-phosphoheptulonate synthase [Nitrososphaerales archaeon]
MSVIMKPGASKTDLAKVIRTIESKGLETDIMHGEFQNVIGIIGDEKKIDFELLKTLPGVYDTIRIQTPYRLMSRAYISKDVVVKVGNVSIGGDNPPVYIAGPCSIESYEQLSRIAKKVKESGANILRGGAFKPRSSVHAFQGLGVEGLKHLRNVGKDLDIPTITEVRGEDDVDVAARYADILQIGARNMYNQDLIEKAAGTGKPIFFKRGFSAQIDEYLGFAERIIAKGNKKIILCERGISPLGGSYKNQTRFTLDLNAIPVIKKETPFPIIADPSHGTGRRDLVFPMAKASIAAGAHGLMIEVHDRPDEALSDGAQAVDPAELSRIIEVCNRLYRTLSSETN